MTDKSLTKETKNGEKEEVEIEFHCDLFKKGYHDCDVCHVCKFLFKEKCNECRRETKKLGQENNELAYPHRLVKLSEEVILFLVQIGKSGNDIIEFVDKNPGERREHERIPFREDIVVDGVMKSTSVDISENGLYVSTMQPFDENTVIDVTIPVKGELLTVKAIVQYSQVGIGMGVKFINLNDEQRRKLKELIDRIKR